MGIRISPAAVRSLLAVTVLLGVAWAGSESQAQSFPPRPQGGISGALLPNERHLWTYDAASGQICRGARRCLGRIHAEPAQARQAADLRLRRRLGGDPLLGLDQQGDLPDRQGSRHQDHLLRPGVQTGEGGDLRRAAVAAEAGFRDRLQLAVRCRGSDHEDLRRGQDPGRHHRRLASRTPSSSAPTTTSPARSAARPPATTPRASANAAMSRSSTASTPARAMPPPSASPASSTACRRSAGPSRPTASNRRSSTPAPRSRR